MTSKQDVLTMPHEQIEKIQLEGIKKTVVQCYENVPFYHDLFDEAGFDPYAVESFEDLAKAPFTTNTLYRLYVKWPIISEAYLDQVFTSLRTIGFFDLMTDE